MMEKYTIQAAIVSNEQPPRVVVDANGNLPEMTYPSEQDVTVTSENAFHAFGYGVLNHALHISVDYRYPLDEATVYQAKPISPRIAPAEPYRWGECPDNLSLQ